MLLNQGDKKEEEDINGIKLEMENNLIETVDDESCELSSSEKQGLFSINLRMIPTKTMYFFWGGLIGSYYPYINPFLTSVGLSTSQAGLITGFRFVASTIAGPLWGALADYTERWRLVLIVLSLASVVSIFPVPWIAKALNESSSNKSCCTQYNITNVSISTSNRKHKFIHVNNHLFYTLMVITIVSSVFLIPLITYLESIAMKVIKTGKRNANYGGQRIFGSLGSCAATYLGGLAADNYHHDGMSNYTAVFYVYLFCGVAVLPWGYYLLSQVTGTKVDKDKSIKNEVDIKDVKNKHLVKDLRKLVKNRDIIFFMITLFVSGLSFNIFIYFSILLISDEMNTSKAKMSLVVVISSMSSMVMFPFTSLIMKCVGGPTAAMTLGIFSYVIRYIGMSYTTKLWLMVLLQISNGVGFALTWSAVMEYVHEISPKEIKSTIYLMTSSIHFGISALLANLVGGHIYSLLGGRILFRSVGIVCGVWGCVMIAYYRTKFFRSAKKKHETITSENSDNKESLLKHSQSNVDIATTIPK